MAILSAHERSTAGSLIQLLTPEGERVANSELDVHLADIDGAHGQDVVRGLYRDMVMTRRFDTEATTLQRQGELGIWASSLGQEAAQVGSARALMPADHVFPSYREHGVAWCRGLDLEALLRMFRGLSHGGWDPEAHHMHLYSIVIGSQTLHAVGYAMGIQRDLTAAGHDPSDASSAAEAGLRSDVAPVVVTYFGDGATSEGDTNEAFVWASVFGVPVVFFCQNNQWAISEPLERQTRIPLYRRARGFGFPGVRVDGNDVLACLAVTRAAAEHARSGQGPVLIEAFTYRMGAHTTSDDPTRYRMASELDDWRSKDPIERLKTYLIRAGAADTAWTDEVASEADALVLDLRRQCLERPDPDPLGLFDDVYSAPFAPLERQRQEYQEYLAGLEEHRAPEGEPAKRPAGQATAAAFAPGRVGMGAGESP